MKENQEYSEKSNQIRQLAALPIDQLTDHLTQLHSNIDQVAPHIAPHVHSTAINAIQYLNGKLPSGGNELVQDRTPEVSSAERHRWLDLHETVNNPLSVLDKIQRNQLNQHHLEAIQSVYPDLHQEMVEKMNEHLGKMKLEGKELPYEKRNSLSLFMGQPLDSTMTPQARQAIIASANTQSQTQQAANKPNHRPSGAALSQINKVNALYQTPQQAHEAAKKD